MVNFTIFLVLITIVSFLLIVVIMVQNPKSGGLSSTFGGAQIGGVQKTNDFLNKSTWTLATILVALVLLSSLSFSANFAGSGDQDLIDESAVPAAPAKANGTAAPAAQPQGATTPAPAAPAKPQN
jgi:preprotein translocase subunit SecG